MKTIAISLLACALAGAAHGADLFESNKLLPIKQGDVVAPEATIGGYAIYPGDSGWKFEQGKSEFVIGPSSIWMGHLVLVHRQGSQLVAWQNISANLSRSLDTVGWRGGPCGAEHLVKKIGRSGSAETCLTIDPHLNAGGNRNVMYFGVGLTHGAARGRYQQIYLALNAEVFGFRDTSPGDWTAAGLESKPRRREFIDKLTAWAEKLQESAGKAFEKNEAGDFYKGMPSYLSLMTVPDDLKGGDYSLSFIGAVEDLKNKDGFKAIAFSQSGPGDTRWNNTWNQATQDDANKRAVEFCDRDRGPSRPPCRLYPPK